MEYSSLTDFDSKLSALKDLNCPGEIIDKIVMDDDFPWGSEKAEVAKDLIASHNNTMPEQLKNLFENAANKEQKHKILQNPSCPKSLIKKGFEYGWRCASDKENKIASNLGWLTTEKLLGHPDFPSIRVGILFENIDMYEWFLEKAPKKRFLLPIASNENCPHEILEKIITDFDEHKFENVIIEAIKNENFIPNLEFLNQFIFTEDISKIEKGIEILKLKQIDEKISQEFTIEIYGDGGEFTQGLIEKSVYQKIKDISKEKGISVEKAWGEATFPSANNNDDYNSLELEDYYEYNELGHFYGPDLSKIGIKMHMGDSKEINNLYDILSELDQIESISQKNGRLVQFSDLGKNIVTGLTDERGFNYTQKFKVDGIFNWANFKLKIFATDEVGLGKDFGDFFAGYSYGGTSHNDITYESKGKSFDAFIDNLDVQKLDNSGVIIDFNSDEFIEMLNNYPEDLISFLNSKNGGYPASRFRKELALNPKLSKSVIQVLLKDDFRWVREASAMNVKITNEDITNKISSADRYTLKGYLLNPNCSEGNKSKIRDLIKDETKYPIETNLYKLGFNGSVYPSEQVMGTVSIEELADCIVDYEGIWSDYVWDNDWYNFDDMKHTYGMSDTATDVEYPDGKILPIDIKSDVNTDDDEDFDINEQEGFVCSGESYEKGIGWDAWKHYEAELEYELKEECIEPTFDDDICDGYKYESENLDGSLESETFEDNGEYSTTGKGTDFDINVDVEEMMSEMEESGTDITDSGQVISWLKNSTKNDEKKK
jgi:hypothetical protein